MIYRMEYSIKLFVFLLGLFACFHEGFSLTCYYCADPNDPQCSALRETQCIYPQDTCFKYSGNFRDAQGTLYIDRVLRSCGVYSSLHAISPKIEYDRCAYVVDGYDMGTGTTYSGTFCLCDDDRCNSA